MNQDFNISKAIAKKEAITRDGKKATQIVLLDAPDDSYPLVGVVDGIVQTWTTSGREYNNGTLNKLDLFTLEDEG